MLRHWIVAGAAFVLLASQVAEAQTWDGGGATNNWTDPFNWNPDGVPGQILTQLTFAGTTRLSSFADAPWNVFSINFSNTAGPFVISGSPLSGVTGISNSDNDLQLINNPLNLGFAPSITAAAGPLVFGGSIQNNGNHLGVSGNFDTQINGIVSGAGTVTKNGTGTLAYGGGLANTYTGTTTVNAGTLVLGKAAGNASNNFGSAFAGPLVINAGGTVRLVGQSQIPDNQPVTIGGTLDVNGFSEGVTTPVTFNGGSLTTSGGTFILGANLISNANATAATISGNLSLNGGVRTFTVNDGPADVDLDIPALVSSGGIVKEGIGTLRLRQATLASGVTLNAGRLIISNNSALGTLVFTINGGTIDNEALLISNPFLPNPLVLGGDFSVSGDCRFAAGATLTGTRRIDVPPSFQNALRISGSIVETAGGYGIIKDGPGILSWLGAGDNTYSGTTTVNEGSLLLGKDAGFTAIAGALVVGDGMNIDRVLMGRPSQIADASPVTINSSGELVMDVHDDVIGSLSMTGGSVTGTGVLGVNGNITYQAGSQTTANISAALNPHPDSLFQINDGTQAIDMDITGQVSMGINKVGAGTLRLGGTVPIFLTTSVNVAEGTVVLNKSGAEIYGAFHIGNAVGGAGADVVRLDASNQIADGTPVRVVTAGLLNLNNFNDRIGHVQMQGGSITTGNGMLTLAAGLEAQFTGSTISGRLSLDGVEQIFQIADDPSTAPEIDISAVISNGSLRKTDFGTLRLSGTSANTYSGLTTVDQGTVVLAKPVGVNAIPGDLVIGNAVNSASDSRVQPVNAEQISDSSSVTMNHSGILIMGSFSETVRNLTLNGGFLDNANGTLRTTATFTYNAGLVHTRISSWGTAVFNADFSAGGGMDNFGSMTVGSGRTVSLNGNGLYNDGLITLAGGTISGSGQILNIGTISGAGTISGGGQFLNLAQLTITGGNLEIGKNGESINGGNIDIPAGSQLRLTGTTGSLANNGTITLAGGSITGFRPLTNNAGGTISGRGMVGVLDINRGTIMAQGGTLNIPNPVNNPGMIRLINGAGLAGGPIANTGVIQGDGSVSNPVSNSGTIEGIGTLVIGGTLANNAAGVITAGPGSKVLVAAGLATNPGVINLTGGTFHNNGFELSNTGQMSGFGTLFTGGLTNNGTITFTGGFTTINGNVTNAAGKQLRVAHNPALFTGTVTNNGILKNTETTITFAGTYNENGLYISDPADNFFSDVNIGADGAWVGGVGDRFFVTGNLKSTSKAALSWQTNDAELHLIGGIDHILSIAGEDRGPSFDGYIDNFAWGALVVGSGDGLVLEDADATADGAIYVQKLLLGGGLSQISAIESNGLSVYYHLGDPSNAYLNGQHYALPGGGSIAPVPEPAAALGLLVLSMMLRGRRRK